MHGALRTRPKALRFPYYYQKKLMLDVTEIMEFMEFLRDNVPTKAGLNDFPSAC